MDLLYTRNFDGFFLVSSDSDFTRLATRLREAGLEVIGFGEKKTPEPFRASCNKFIFTESILTDEELIEPSVPSSQTKIPEPIQINDDFNELKNLFKEAIDACKEEDGWAHLGTVGSHMQRLDSSFDPRNYQHKQLGKLVHSLDFIEIQNRETDKGQPIPYIKIKD